MVITDLVIHVPAQIRTAHPSFNPDSDFIGVVVYLTTQPPRTQLDLTSPTWTGAAVLVTGTVTRPLNYGKVGKHVT